MTRFTDTVAFVTGATSGIGRTAALAFAREGASVVVADIAADGVEETAGLIEQAGGQALAVTCDVARADDITEAQRSCTSRPARAPPRTPPRTARPSSSSRASACASARQHDRRDPARRPGLLRAGREPLARRGGEPLHGPPRHAAERRVGQPGHVGRARQRRALQRRAVHVNPTYDFSGQVALVTGAGAGMGLDTARAFAAAGAAVVLADVNQEALRIATDELTAAGHRALGATCDVADEDQVAALVDRTVAEFGRLDMAFNNAGI